MNKAAAVLICIRAASAAGAAETKEYESIKRTDVRYWLKGVSDGYMTATGFLASDSEQPL